MTSFSAMSAQRSSISINLVANIRASLSPTSGLPRTSRSRSSRSMRHTNEGSRALRCRSRTQRGTNPVESTGAPLASTESVSSRPEPRATS